MRQADMEGIGDDPGVEQVTNEEEVEEEEMKETEEELKVGETKETEEEVEVEEMEETEEEGIVENERGDVKAEPTDRKAPRERREVDECGGEETSREGDRRRENGRKVDWREEVKTREVDSREEK